MAVSTLSLTFVTPKPKTLKGFTPKTTPKAFRTTASSLHSSNSTSTSTKKRISQVGLGLLAASIVSLTPLDDANATRIEYYATTADPPCEFNFVRSGLGYCDIAVGSGPDAPYGQLINVSSYSVSFSSSVFVVCGNLQFLLNLLEEKIDCRINLKPF